MNPKLTVVFTLAAILLAACSGSSKPTTSPSATIAPPASANATTSPTSAAGTGTITDCPVDGEICAFAANIEVSVRGDDVASIVKGYQE